MNTKLKENRIELVRFALAVTSGFWVLTAVLLNMLADGLGLWVIPIAGFAQYYLGKYTFRSWVERGV